MARPSDSKLITTGVFGLDDILGGGISPFHVYLIEGNPGSGKTTLALQYLIHGAEKGEKGIYITLSESKAELTASSASHHWSLDGIEILELLAPEAELDPDNQYAMFQTSDLELSNTTKEILAAIDRSKPARVVIDSLSELRMLAQSPLRYRRQILALKQFFIGRECTVFLLDDMTSEAPDRQLQSIAHGVINLEQLSPEFGAERRRLRVIKLRGQKYRGGYHDFNIEAGGLRIFPRLIAAEHNGSQARGLLKSGNEELDTLAGGGLQFGTSVVLLGPSGAGKSTLALQYAHAAAARGEGAAIFAFDERLETIFERSNGLGLDTKEQVRSGAITIMPIDPAELSSGEFAQHVRDAVEGKDRRKPAKVIVIDSLNGYMNAMPGDKHMAAQLHELLTYLGHKGVVTFLIATQHGLLGVMESPLDTTYLADTVFLFRYFESGGAVKQALAILKKRSGQHERTIREFRLSSRGLDIGKPLEAFHGVLTGTPTYVGGSEALIKE